ncbi:MAG: diadenylate cyclase CdaA [Bacteroidales bacterium]|nr:diadenylate cyclase CdaA [Bacteroidales bacterium]MEE3406814.1 diadenylate cyclase CdaA [Candidatus Cryptobacteroides sp.]SKC34670.1 TIGR00159 family protein [Bacteroidales bacterium WCE2008]MBP5740618.1 diadenylate cyclase CdaA [Bacteroidales bacterium]MBQ1856762.1 diadenylate cyclase CdaA [Bacteroidales bacterium]
MILGVFDILNVSPMDLLDILLVALIIFIAFRWIRNSSALNIFLAVIVIYVLMVIVDALNMKLMSSLLGTFIDVGVLALIVIFQPEIRHFLYRIGSETKLGTRSRVIIEKLFGQKGQNLETADLNEVAEACRTMSDTKTGALIVFPHIDSLQYIIETGDRIDATINRRLILNLFFKNSPLHDGAMIINGSRIVAARCTLPITDRQDIPARFGMRHKAAIGISEVSDADVIVVSEETGDVSFIHRGEVTHIENMNELKLLLGRAFSGQSSNPDNKN